MTKTRASKRTTKSTSPLKFMGVIDAWLPGVDKTADEDLADQQERLATMRCDTRAQAESLGVLLAAHPRNTTPGEFRIMVGRPDEHSVDGYEWVEEQNDAGPSKSRGTTGTRHW